MSRPQPTPASRRVDPDSPAGARRVVLGWSIMTLVGPFVIALCAGGWAVAQANHYEDNLRGWEYGDPFPWVPVVLGAVWTVVALVVTISKAVRAARIRREHG